MTGGKKGQFGDDAKTGPAVAKADETFAPVLRQRLQHPGARPAFQAGGCLSGTRHMNSHRDRLREDAKFRVLRLLQENPEMSQCG